MEVKVGEVGVEAWIKIIRHCGKIVLYVLIFYIVTPSKVCTE
jgi:hypothetical protein